MKRIVCIAVCIILVLSVVSPLAAFADEANTIVEIMGFTGTLYLSDWIDNSVIVKDVKPVAESAAALAAAADLEYNAIPAFAGNIYDKNGTELDLSSLAWYIDTSVKFIVVRLSGGGYRVVRIVVQ